MASDSRSSPLLTQIAYYGIPLAVIAFFYRFLYFKRKVTSLNGKVVFLTGASSGVGEALAHCLYRNGCKVVLAARRESELQRVKKELLDLKLSGTTHEPLIVYLDLGSIETIEPAVQKAYEVFGQIDILVNNGGISCRGNVMSMEIDTHIKLMYINYFGPVALTKAILNKMVENKNGHIVFVSSVQGRIAIPDRSAYAASKHACQAFADTMRAEVKKHNINVSVISPGYIKTALSLNALTGSGEQYGVMDTTTASGYTPEFVAEKIVDMLVTRSEEVVLAPATHRFAIVLRSLFPSAYFWIMAKRAK